MILIPVNGPVTELDPGDDFLLAARRALGCDVDIVVARKFADVEPIVMAVDEYGAMRDDRQINQKAWWFYGRSPIYGDAVVWHDRHEPLPDEVLAAATAPVPPAVLAMMGDRA